MRSLRSTTTGADIAQETITALENIGLDNALSVLEQVLQLK